MFGVFNELTEILFNLMTYLQVGIDFGDKLVYKSIFLVFLYVILKNYDC